MERKKGVRSRNGEAPTLARFQPKYEYVSTFDMLHDAARNHAYSAAVRLQSKQNNGSTTAPLRWLDIGTGSGLLASLVAAASSRRTEVEVYACEGVSDVADVAAETFEKNGKYVRLFRGRSTEMEVGKDLPARVPHVISELLGTSLLEEGILPTLRDAQARLLSPGYVSIPDAAEVWAFCCESSEFHSMSRLLTQAAERSGEAFLRPPSAKWECCPGTASPVSVRARFRPLTPSVRIFGFDFSSHGDPLPGPDGRTREVRFPIDSGGGGTVHAVVCWWRCFMDKGRTITMSTSPLQPPKEPLDEDAPSEKGAPPPEEEPALAAAPPSRDHWRQSVFLLGRPLNVRAGDAVRALARHDDSTVWFHAVEREPRSTGADQGTVAAAASPGEPAMEGSQLGKSTTGDTPTTVPFQPTPVEPASAASDESAKPAPEGEGATAPARQEPSEDTHAIAREIAAREPRGGPAVPPVCVCGLHRTCPPSRIWMLNDASRTASFRSVIRSIVAGDAGHHVTNGSEKPQQNNTANTSAAGSARIKRRPATPASACVACISDGFLLPLLAAQAGASEVLEIQPSAAYAAVCRDVYRANGVDVEPDGNGGDPNRRVIRPFPGGVSNVHELLMPSPGSAAPDTNGFGSAGRKLDAVIGEPFFADMSTATWPLESVLLFWCARTALEADGCFSPRTRVVPARARLLACPFACGLLFRGRRPVGSVEGVDMSAMNRSLGVGYVKPHHCGPSMGGADGGEDAKGGGIKCGDVVSVRLSEYGHELLGPPTVVLDMDLTRPLCDLRGGRKELRCHGRPPSSTCEAGETESAPQQPGRETSDPVCHGVALWLDIWLDEEGLHRLSTGPVVPYWPQGVLFFEEDWGVPPCGRGFHLEAALEDGALSVGVS